MAATPDPVLEQDVVWLPGESREARLAPIPSALGDRVPIAADPVSASAAAVVLEGDLLRLTVPPSGAPRRVVVLVSAADAVALWQPGSGEHRGRLPPSWAAPSDRGDFAGPALAVLVGSGDRALVGVAADGPHLLRFRAGMVEETAQLLVEVVDDAGAEPLVVLVDLRGGPFAAAVRALGHEIGLDGPGLQAASTEPVYCTWYSFHQAMTAAEVAADAARAAQLGFGAVIVDDGWQTDDAARGYGSCGDWVVEPARFPDARAFVTRLRGLGLRTLWWVGTPFVGHRSDAYAAGEYALQYDDAGMEAAVLDPRSAGTRRLLAERLLRLLDDTGADGLKIDFLERFAGTPRAAAPEDADVATLEDGAAALLDDLRTGRDLMIEFREPYVSRATVGRATMLRVGDCPLSPTLNRVGIVDLRLATSGIAIHADPVMWAPGAPPERVAQHLLGALFGVPQVSVRLHGLPEAQEAVLAHWIGFWNRHRDLLLGAPLEVRGVADGYPVVQARAEDAVVTARYAPLALDVPDGDWSIWHVADAADGPLVVRGGGAATVEIRDAAGRVLEPRHPVDLRLAELAVPTGGLATLTRTDAR